MPAWYPVIPKGHATPAHTDEQEEQHERNAHMGSKPESILTTVVSAIVTGQVDDDIDNIWDTLRARSKIVTAQRAAINAATIKVGARVTLHNLSPKSLNGATGVVVPDPAWASRGRKAKLTVKLDHSQWRRNGGERKQVTVPASCVSLIE